VGDESARIIEALKDACVAGADQFGTFVNDTHFLAPSKFDERAAMPTLIKLLPTIHDSRDLWAAVGHLGRPWARPVAFEPLLQIFLIRAEQDHQLGWSIGDALVTTATASNVETLLEISTDRKYGSARQMIVYSLWRFKKDEQIKNALIGLLNDSDVSLHAMSALRRTVGNEEAIEYLNVVRDASDNQTIRKQAQKAITKSETAIAKSTRAHPHHGLGTRND